jgi:hypothetical protein
MIIYSSIHGPTPTTIFTYMLYLLQWIGQKINDFRRIDYYASRLLLFTIGF